MSGTGTISKVSYEFECKDSDAFWRVYRMHLTEGINSCFKLILDLVTRDVDTDPDVLLGASSQLYISRDGCQ